MLAKINGLFRLTRDLEIATTQGGVTIGKFGLVCSEKYKNKETTLFIDGVAFGKTAEILAQYAGNKGTQIYLSGKLQTESWEKDGQKKSKISMTIEGFDFVSNKQQQQSNYSENPNSSNGQQSYQPQQQQSYQQPQAQYENKQGQPVSQQQYQQQRPSSSQVPVIDIDEESIPF